MSWTHTKCDSCWQAHEPGRVPFRLLREAPAEPCCWCGRETTSGIYVREDPVLLPCQDHD